MLFLQDSCSLGECFYTDLIQLVCVWVINFEFGLMLYTVINPFLYAVWIVGIELQVLFGEYWLMNRNHMIMINPHLKNSNINSLIFPLSLSNKI